MQRNFWLNIVDGVAIQSSLTLASPAAILPLFVAQYTQARWVAALVPAIFLIGALPQLWLGARAERSADFQKAAVLQSLAPRLALVVLALVPWLPAAWVLPCFFLVLALFSLSLSGGAPSWLTFIGHVIPAEKRGTFFGYRKALGGVATVAASLGAAWLLQTLPGPTGFAACFGLAALIWLPAIGCMTGTRHNWAAVERPAPLPLRAALADLWGAQPAFRRYMVARAAMACSGMAGGFYVLDAATRFGLGPAAASLLGLAFTFVPSLAGAYWGRLIDRVGHQPVLVGAAIAAGLANMALPLAGSLPFLVACLVLVGCGQAVAEIADNRAVLELGTARSSSALALFNLALMPATLLALLVAGWLSPALVFQLAGGAWLLGAAALLTPSPSLQTLPA
ncbi:MAG: major facilitator transporter [Cyanobacteria bacterium RYN_339]|nr:major facilitator transporter [Cyanobacteria bacterium RYN_339]